MLLLWTVILVVLWVTVAQAWVVPEDMPDGLYHVTVPEDYDDDHHHDLQDNSSSSSISSRSYPLGKRMLSPGNVTITRLNLTELKSSFGEQQQHNKRSDFPPNPKPAKPVFPIKWVHSKPYDWGKEKFPKPLKWTEAAAPFPHNPLPPAPHLIIRPGSNYLATDYLPAKIGNCEYNVPSLVRDEYREAREGLLDYCDHFLIAPKVRHMALSVKGNVVVYACNYQRKHPAVCDRREWAYLEQHQLDRHCRHRGVGWVRVQFKYMADGWPLRHKVDKVYGRAWRHMHICDGGKKSKKLKSITWQGSINEFLEKNKGVEPSRDNSGDYPGHKPAGSVQHEDGFVGANPQGQGAKAGQQPTPTWDPSWHMTVNPDKPKREAAPAPTETKKAGEGGNSGPDAADKTAGAAGSGQ